MALYQKRECERRIRFFGVGEIARISFVRGLDQSVLAVLRCQIVLGDNRFQNFVIDFFARIDPRTNVKGAILRIEREPLVVGPTFGIVRARGNAGNNASR